MVSSRSTFTLGPDTTGPDRGEVRRPEFADVGRYGRLLVDRFVTQARSAQQPTFRSIIATYLETAVEDLAVVEEVWPAFEHVNVQAALDAWLAVEGRTHQVIGLADYRHRGGFGLSDLLAEDPHRHNPRPGNVTRISLPSGPDGQTRDCLRAALVLVQDGHERIGLLLRGADPEEGRQSVTVELVSQRPDVARSLAAQLRALALELNVYRAHVVSFGHSTFGERSSLLRFHQRPHIR